MNKKTKVNAAILIIGNEILSGRTQDTNTSTLATWLNSIGVKVNEVRVIPDVEKTIIATLNLLRKENNYVFTTGGIGPTHDDITAQSVSKAFGLKYFKINSNQKSKEIIKKVLNNDEPCLCEVFIDPNQTISPKLEFGRPIEDLSPLLNREIFNKFMPPSKIKLKKANKNFQESN